MSEHFICSQQLEGNSALPQTPIAAQAESDLPLRGDWLPREPPPCFSHQTRLARLQSFTCHLEGLNFGTFITFSHFSVGLSILPNTLGELQVLAFRSLSHESFPQQHSNYWPFTYQCFSVATDWPTPNTQGNKKLARLTLSTLKITAPSRSPTLKPAPHMLTAHDCQSTATIHSRHCAGLGRLVLLSGCTCMFVIVPTLGPSFQLQSSTHRFTGCGGS